MQQQQTERGTENEDAMDRTGGHRHAGPIILSDKSTAYDDLKDWLLDYYDIDIAAEYLYAAAHEN